MRTCATALHAQRLAVPVARHCTSQMPTMCCGSGELLGPQQPGLRSASRTVNQAAAQAAMDTAACCERTTPLAASTSYSQDNHAPIAASEPRLRALPSRCPGHVSLVLDGNQRWAARRGLLPWDGHEAGVNSLRDIVQTCARLQVSVLTVFGFSAENWTRGAQEVDMLFSVIERALERDLSELIANGVRLKFFGDLEQLPASLQTAIARAEALTHANTGLQLGVALNYGGRQDMVQAAQRIAQLVEAGAITAADVNEDLLGSLLQSSAMCQERGPPDLLIRTSGEMRLSNFMLWDLAYTELYFTPKHWPEFGEDDLLLAFEEYSKRDRRFGRRRQET